MAAYDHAVSMEGWEWIPGSIVMSEVDLPVPADLATGTYSVQSSLFDPNQKKNAVYFDMAEPGKLILVLNQKIELP